MNPKCKRDRKETPLVAGPTDAADVRFEALVSDKETPSTKCSEVLDRGNKEIWKKATYKGCCHLIDG